ncbi:MAG: RNA-binding ATPase activator esf2 [Cirrosporium novae-zelandiae]|nr:MAG: RNA-binding ATPase activator esf2 [Cirrosporium novae-zelandiae]
MATRKRNEFLDHGFSDDEEDDRSYDSEALEERKGGRVSRLTSKTNKRRKLDNNESDHEDENDPENEHGSIDLGNSPVKSNFHSGPQQQSLIAQSADFATSPSLSSPSKSPISSRTKAKPPMAYVKAQKVAHKTGILYISRIPPFMKPSTVRTLLSPYGSITRLFLTPEPTTSYLARKRSGGNKKHSYIDGWVEFTRKRDAKNAAELLNTQIIGGKKSGWYHDDVWNLKYLKGFKWADLMEQVRNEEAERAARLRADLARVGRENKEFVKNVERAKMLEGMEAKKKAKAKGRIGEGDIKEPVENKESLDNSEKSKGRREFHMHFRQNEVKLKTAKRTGADDQPDDVKRVLSKIF